MEGMRETRVRVAIVVSFVLIASSFALSIGRPETPAAPVAGSVSALLTNVTLTRRALVIPMGELGSLDELQAGASSVIFDGFAYRMWYFGCTPSYFCSILYATSADGWSWTKVGPALLPEGGLESIVAYPSVVRVGSSYWMYYAGWDGVSYRIFGAVSSNGLNWTRLGVAIDLGPPGAQDAHMAVLPWVVYHDGGYLLWYTGISGPNPPNAAIMFATSADGLNWTKRGTVLTAGPPGSADSFQVSYPGVLAWGSEFRMFYTGYTDVTNTSIMYAESTDGLSWTRRGIALAALPPLESLVAAPDPVVALNGTWLVYYTARAGVSDLQIYLATYVPPATGTSAPGLDLTLVFLLLFTAVGAAAVLAVAIRLGRTRPRRP